MLTAQKKCTLLSFSLSLFLSIFGQIFIFQVLAPKFWHNDSMELSEGAPITKLKKTALCMIVTNEELYLDEFVDYHHALGFNKFFVYDNTEGFEMKQWGKLKGDHVELIPFPGPNRQLAAYVDCGKTVAATEIYEWVAFFDADEFLVLKEHDHVADMLGEYCPHGSLAVNWFMFQSHWNLQTPEPITRRFLYRNVGVHKLIKTIVRLEDIETINLKPDPHNFVKLKNQNMMHDSNGKNITGPFNPNGPADVVVLHHYNHKSAKEYVQKRTRGRATTNATHPSIKANINQATQVFQNALASEHLPHDESIYNNPDLIFDDSAWQFLKKNVPGYVLYDKIALMPVTNNTTA